MHRSPRGRWRQCHGLPRRGPRRTRLAPTLADGYACSGAGGRVLSCRRRCHTGRGLEVHTLCPVNPARAGRHPRPIEGLLHHHCTGLQMGTAQVLQSGIDMVHQQLRHVSGHGMNHDTSLHRLGILRPCEVHAARRLHPHRVHWCLWRGRAREAPVVREGPTRRVRDGASARGARGGAWGLRMQQRHVAASQKHAAGLAEEDDPIALSPAEDHFASGLACADGCRDVLGRPDVDATLGQHLPEHHPEAGARRENAVADAGGQRMWRSSNRPARRGGCSEGL
mmetsp:Transcript_67282/g.219118  ORF Transcript_67282/g.219118 Transcript_67282/m.219118 type:complete len:281 (+) Transcript_67282:1293-2135(+)